MAYSFDVKALMPWGIGKKLAPIALGAKNINKMISEGEADGVVLDPYRGTEKNLDTIVKSIPDARIISISNLPDFDMNITQAAVSVEELSIPHTKCKINIDLFPNLRRLGCKWSEDGIIGANESCVEELNIWGYISKSCDFDVFPEFKFLKKLRVIQSNVSSLQFIDRFSLLNSLNLHHNNRLTCLDGLSLPVLKHLTLDTSRKLQDYSSIRNCPRLEFLKMNNCGPINSLDFLDSLIYLRSFRFLGTIVVDGDLVRLARLEDVYFTPRRGYSHKLIEFRRGDAELAKEGWDLE